MAKGNEIIVSAEPKGHFEECVISGTPKPGTVMELVPATSPQGGRFTYRACTRADGAKGPIAVLLPDSLQGKLATDAYTNASRGFLYWPIAGEELNMLLRYQPGTGTASTDDIGELLEVDGASGMLQADTGVAAVSTPFMILENIDAAFTADRLTFVKYLGNNA